MSEKPIKIKVSSFYDFLKWSKTQACASFEIEQMRFPRYVYFKTGNDTDIFTVKGQTKLALETMLIATQPDAYSFVTLSSFEKDQSINLCIFSCKQGGEPVLWIRPVRFTKKSLWFGDWYQNAIEGSEVQDILVTEW